MLQYDPSILIKLAARYESQARRIVFVYTLVAGVFAYLGQESAVAMKALPQESLMRLAIVVMGVLIGFLASRERAFQLRVQAHTILCQVEIEKNTRKT